MRTTMTLDDDVAAMLERERQRTGESMRDVTNRLLRQGLQRARGPRSPVDLPVLDGCPQVDVADVSGVLADLDDERIAGKKTY